MAQAGVLDADARHAEVLERAPLDEPHWHERVTGRLRSWMLRRLQKRIAREWREYDATPKVSLGPWRRRRAEQGGTQIYRSLVQIHFHPRARVSRQTRDT